MKQKKKGGRKYVLQKMDRKRKKTKVQVKTM